MSKRLRVFLISALAIMLIMTCTVFTVTATNEFKMIDNASIRVSVTADGFYGIKFAATVQDTDKNYKMLIIPEDYYEGYLNAADKGEKNVVEYLIGRFGADKLSIVNNCALRDNVVEGSIVKIKYNNLNRGFLGIAYYETENEGATVYNLAALATESPKSYTIVDKAAEAYVLDEYQGIDVVLDSLKSIILDGVKQANGVLEADKDTTAATITLAEKTKKVFVGDTFKLDYTPAIATSLATYSGENVTVAADKTITAVTVGTSTITADLLGVKDTMELTVVSKDITGLETNGKVISWEAAVGADKYIVTVNGTETEVTTNSYTLTTGGVYDISVCAVVGEVKGNTASIEDYIYTEDDIALLNMKDISFTTLNHESGNITFKSVKDGLNWRNNATLVLKNQYGSGKYFKVGFTSVGTTMNYNVQKFGISFLRAEKANSNLTDNIAAGQYSFVFPDFTETYINYGENTAYNYVSGVATGVGNTWIGSNFYMASSLTANTKYYIAVGFEGTGIDKVVNLVFMNSSSEILRAMSWSYRDLVDVDSKFAELPETGYFSFHSWQDSNTAVTFDYEVVDKEDLFKESQLIAPQVKTDGASVRWSNALADKYLVSVNGGAYEETTATGMTFENYGVYNLSVKAVFGATESSSTSVQAIYLEDDITILNAQNISFDKLNYESGNITFNSVSGLTWRNASTIILKKQYTDELIKVGFTAVGTSIGNGTQKFGIGVRGASATSTDTVTPGQYSLYLPEFGGGAAINYSDNRAVNYVADGTNSKNIKPYAGVALNTDLVVGQKYYAVTGFVGKGNDAVFHFALLDSNENLLYATYWNYKDIVAFNANFAAVPDSGYYSIYSFQDAEKAVTLDYEFITLTELQSKAVVKNTTTSSISENNGVKTYNFTASSSVVESSNWRESATVTIAEPYKNNCKNEFIKVGFKPVTTSTGARLDDQRINVVYRAASVLSGSYPSGAWHTIFFNNGATNLKLCYNGDSVGGGYSQINGISTLDTTKNHYIITGVVTTESATTFYYMLTVDNGNGETLLAYKSWALSSIDTAGNGINDSGMFVINVSTPLQTSITTEMLSEADGMGLVSSAENKVVVDGAASSYTSSITGNGYSVKVTTNENAAPWNFDDKDNEELPKVSVNIRTSANTYDDEFVKVGFTAAGTNLADNDINIAPRTASTSNTSQWRNTWSLMPIKDGTILLSYNAGGPYIDYVMHNNFAEDYLVNGMVVGANYYIVAGIVNNNDIYFMLYKVETTGDVLVATATWDFSSEVVNGNNTHANTNKTNLANLASTPIPASGYIVVSLYTPSVTKTITVDILSATEASALINAIPSAE